MTQRPTLQAEKLRIGYGGSPLLPALDMEIQPGTFWAIVGRNGSGKSTLFRTLLGLHPPVSGKIHRGACWRPAYVPQRSHLDAIVPLRVAEVVSLGMDRDWSFFPFFKGHHRHVVEHSLDQVGAAPLLRAQFHELSEGQKQRVLLARVLAGNANIAFLDEPTAAMDSVAEREAMDIIDMLRRDHGIAILMVSHFLHVAREVADQVLFLDREMNCVETGNPEVVFQSDNFRRRYGEGAY